MHGIVGASQMLVKKPTFLTSAYIRHPAGIGPVARLGSRERPATYRPVL